MARFELAVIDQGKLWIHNAVYPLAAAEALIPRFVDLVVRNLQADPDAHTYFVMGSRPELGGRLVLFQPISTNVTREMQKNGGNALRPEPGNGPLIIV